MQPITIPVTPDQNITPFNLIIQRESPSWIRLDLGADQNYGDLLLDFSGAADPDVSLFIDGSPRLVIHRPGHGDAALFIRIHPDQLIIDTEFDVVRQLNGRQVIYHTNPLTAPNPQELSTGHQTTVFSITLHSDHSPQLLAILARLGFWVEYTPGPDHHDRITVKDENVPVNILANATRFPILSTQRYPRTFDPIPATQSPGIPLTPEQMTIEANRPPKQPATSRDIFMAHTLTLLMWDHTITDPALRDYLLDEMTHRDCDPTTDPARLNWYTQH